MEVREYECEGCESTHEAAFMKTLPVRSFSRAEVAALREMDAWELVVGFDYHPCEMHPDGEAATEELIIEMDGEFIALRLIGEEGWAVEARREIVEADTIGEETRETIMQMREDVLEDDPHH